MKPAFNLDLEPFELGNSLFDVLIENLPQLVFFDPDGLSDLLNVLRVFVILLTDEAAHLLEVPVLLHDLPQIVPQVNGVVGLMRGRRHEDAMRTDLSVTVKAVEVVLVVMQGTLRLGYR
jgi:hypothetical protein